jgi:hypothetical protein
LQAPEVTVDIATAAGAPPLEVIADNALSDADLAALALKLPRFRGHTSKRDTARGVSHGKAEAKEVHI